MPRIDRIESVADAFASSTIMVEPKRCSHVRNWHSKCKRCLTACKHNSIYYALGRLGVDSETCTDCGACATACPTAALVTTAPTGTAIVRQARACAAQADGTARFVCKRDAESHGVDASKVAILPCLDYLDEYLLVGLFSCGVERIALVRDGCEGCELNCSRPRIDGTVESARGLLDAWGVDGTISFGDELPEQLLSSSGKVARPVSGVGRREAFRQAGGSVMDLAVQAINGVVGAITGEETEKADPDRQVIVRPEETFPADSYRSARLLRMLDRIGMRPYGSTVDTRFWASIDVDPATCRRCGGCALMCATRALRYHRDDEGRSTLVFHPSLCVGCRLCKDTCLSHSMVYSTKVLADDLDADVVKVLYADEPPQKGNPLGL